jgi:probable HAF family extracellular repeat protein
MSRNETAAILLGVCLGLAACDKPAGDLVGPEPATPNAAEEITQLAAGPYYIATHVSTRPGTAYGINKLGQVVGAFERTNTVEPHAFLWDAGVFRDIGTLGGSRAEAFAINNAGQVVGGSYLPGDTEDPNGHRLSHAFLWQNGVMQDLGTIGGSTSSASSINSLGQIVGTTTQAPGSTHIAFLWEGGTMKPLAGLNKSSSSAHGIDNNGRVAGNFGGPEVGTDIRGFWWKAGAVQTLGTLGGATSVANAISPEGKLVGWSTTSSGSTHAFVWRGGVMTDLGTLGGDYSVAFGSNGLGQIVGESRLSPGGRLHAFLWQNGVMLDLGRGSARGINGNGWIVGAQDDRAKCLSRPVPTLWRPTDTPPPPPTPGVVRVGSIFFASTRNGSWNPAVDTVAVGSTVTWDWCGGSHSVQSRGSPSFTSSVIMQNSQAEYKFTFTRAGTYQYDCVRHVGMTGRIIVK